VVASFPPVRERSNESLWASHETEERAGTRAPRLNELMYISQVFLTDPSSGIAVLLCLITIYWCIRVIRRRQGGTDRFLLGLLGVISVCQALRILMDLGVWAASDPFRRLDDFANITTAGLYMIGALLLEISSKDRASTLAHLRLAEAKPGNGSNSPEAPGAVFVLGSDGRVVSCNHAAEMLLGRQQVNLIGIMPIFDGERHVRPEGIRSGTP
jgi:PAS domain-containing protein